MAVTFDLSSNPRPALVASTEARTAEAADRYRAAELARWNAVTAAAPVEELFVQMLARAADQFVVRRGTGTTVIAGYHWFSDWGQDTMIALPGLTLATRRYDDSRGMLLAFAGSVDSGMLPNRFPDAGEAPEYNTVDATLWFFEAVRAFGAHAEDYDFIRARLYPVLADIIAWHERGTRYGIRLDADGLSLAAEPGLQLTRMDAKVGDWVVTARHGKPVEIQALWYNALRTMEDLGQRFGDETSATHWKELAHSARSRFTELFWNEPTGCLFDVVSGDGRDGSIRPNQLLAVSLHHSMLPGEKAKRRHTAFVALLRQTINTEAVTKATATAPINQGTVWPWLMGPFLTAYLKVNGRSAKARRQAEQWLSELRRFMLDEGVGQIPEVFDGDAPHSAGGCLVQAWSVAELLRVSVEDIRVIKPARRVAATAPVS
jgi:predicted glycogen debranching enzyme